MDTAKNQQKIISLLAASLGLGNLLQFGFADIYLPLIDVFHILQEVGAERNSVRLRPTHLMPPSHLTLAKPKSGFLKLSVRTIDII